jgi:ABC-type cobalamin transport system ATPase subunit
MSKKIQPTKCAYCGAVFVEGQTILEVTDLKTGEKDKPTCEKCYLKAANTGFRTMYVYQEMVKAMNANDKERMDELKALMAWVKAENKVDREREIAEHRAKQAAKPT